MAESFGQIMQHAEQVGAHESQQRKEALRSRIDAAKQKIAETWKGIKEFGSRAKSGLETATAMATTPEIRKELRDFIGQKIEDRRGMMAEKAEARKEANAIKREQLANAVEDRVNALKHSATEKLNSVKNGAVELKNTVVKGAETGFLFTVGAGVVAYEAGAATVDAGIAKGKEVAKDVAQGVEKGALFVAGETVAAASEVVNTGLDLKDRAINRVDQNINYAKYKAREFGDRVNESYTRQKEAFQREMAIRGNEVRGAAHEAVGKASYSIFERLSRFLDRGWEFTAEHRSKASTLKNAVVDLRAQGAMMAPPEISQEQGTMVAPPEMSQAQGVMAAAD